MSDKKGDARPSIHNVAAYAGVSIATVSKVMQGVATVRRENVIAVQNAIEALGYRINPLGAELRRGQRKLVGAIIADFENQGSAHLLSSLERHVESRGYTLMVASNRGSEDREAELVGRMQDWRVAGIIVESMPGWQKAPLLLQDGPPAVFLGNHSAEGLHDVVLDDVPSAIETATSLGMHRSRSIFLPGSIEGVHLKSAIEQAGDCLVRRVSDLDGFGPVFLFAETGWASELHHLHKAHGSTYIQSDVSGTSITAVARLFDRMENPDAPKSVQMVPMKISPAR